MPRESRPWRIETAIPATSRRTGKRTSTRTSFQGIRPCSGSSKPSSLGTTPMASGRTLRSWIYSTSTRLRVTTIQQTLIARLWPVGVVSRSGDRLQVGPNWGIYGTFETMVGSASWLGHWFGLRGLARNATSNLRQPQSQRRGYRGRYLRSSGFALALAASAIAQAQYIPPNVLMVNHKACNVSNVDGRWVAVGTASYLEHENYHHEPWTVNFPFRKTIEASEKDCNKWFKLIAKIQAAAKPVNVQDLKKEKKQ